MNRSCEGISTSIVHLLVGVLFVELVLGFVLQFLVLNIGVIKLPFNSLIEGIVEVEGPVVPKLLHVVPARVEIIVEVVVIHHLWWELLYPCSWSSKYCKRVYWCRWMSRHGNWVGCEII